MCINKNKTIHIFQSFSIEEFHSCIKYIKKHSKHKDILSCISIIKKYYPVFEIEKKVFFSIIYPNQKYIDHRYRNLLYRLDLLIKKYVDSTDSSKDILPHLLHIKNLKNINDTRSYKAQLKLIESKSEKSALETYFLEYEQMEKLQSIGTRQIDTNLQNVNDSLDAHYINEKLKLVCLSINDSIINNRQYDLGYFSQLEPVLEKSISNKNSLTYLLYEAYLFQTNEDNLYFTNVINSITKNKYKDTEELRLIFTMCINYCIRNINKGKFEFFNDLFTIYKEQINAKTIYSSDDKISAVTIKNIITVSLRLNEYKWTEKFIEEHKNKLVLIHREEVYCYLMARLFYTKKDYRKAQQYLLSSEPLDFLNNLSSRVLLCKCLYDSEDMDLLDNAIQNFSIYLLRNKNNSYHYKFHILFIKFLKKIIKIKNDKKIKKELYTKLENETQVAEKTWLLKILE